jgi:hypothetical protein
VLGAFAMPSVGAFFGDRRDVDGFQQYVRTYIDGWSSSAQPGRQVLDRRWAIAHPDLVLEEGDQACAWLKPQPDAPEVDPSGRSTVGTLISTYIKATADDRIPPVARMSESYIVAGAWAYLCKDLREDKTAPSSLYED